MTFEKRPKGSEGGNHVGLWGCGGKSILGERIAGAKALAVECASCV